MNFVVPQYIIKNVNCRGPKSSSEGADDLDIVCTSKSFGSANTKPYQRKKKERTTVTTTRTTYRC